MLYIATELSWQVLCTVGNGEVKSRN